MPYSWLRTDTTGQVAAEAAVPTISLAIPLATFPMILVLCRFSESGKVREKAGRSGLRNKTNSRIWPELRDINVTDNIPRYPGRAQPGLTHPGRKPNLEKSL
jgi:hypothetical protein